MAGGTNGPPVLDGAAFSFASKTLLALRTQIATRTGHAGILPNFAPGMQGLIDDFLIDNQEQLYERFQSKQMRMWYSIPIVQGKRHYGVPSVSSGAQTDISFTASNIIDRVAGSWLDDGFEVGQKITPSGSSGNTSQVTIATVSALQITTTETTIVTEAAGPSITITTVNYISLDFTKVEEVWLLDDTKWLPMSEGINPARFTETGQAYPQNYETTDNFEVWPEPDKAYTAYLLGYFGLKPFAADTDTTTIPHKLVFLGALADAKAHFGQGDSGVYFRRLEVLLRKLNAQKFGNKRYIPHARSRREALPFPVGTWRP